MSNKVKKGAGKDAQANAYKANNRFATNRKRKLLKQQKLQPNNKQVELALKDIHWRRKTPTTPFWSSSMIAQAKLMKEFTGKVDMDMFSADEKKRSAALRAHGPVALQPVSKKKPVKFNSNSMFSIASRLADGREGLQWTL